MPAKQRRNNDQRGKKVPIRMRNVTVHGFAELQEWYKYTIVVGRSVRGGYWSVRWRASPVELGTDLQKLLLIVVQKKSLHLLGHGVLQNRIAAASSSPRDATGAHESKQ
jgi:hypothetical protein